MKTATMDTDEATVPDERSAIAAAMARMRRLSTKRCRHCGETFDGLAISNYCSQNCRQLAYLRRVKKAKQDAAVP